MGLKIVLLSLSKHAVKAAFDKLRLTLFLILMFENH
jgi:hypothetical protein